ncbi:MAG: phytoene/squalene synthase family protein [Pseudomonadota bacterium]
MLKNVSRSFFLTLRVLPEGLREPIGLAYLLARTADTIADTSLVSPEHRLSLLLCFRAHMNGAENAPNLSYINTELAQHQTDSHEHALLASVESMLTLLAMQEKKDQAAIRQVVTTLTQGMELDLNTFPHEQSAQLVALTTLEDLDHYTYLIAGCVGEFWTHLSSMHLPEVKHWDISEMLGYGIRFGKALQMTNILRDCASDLRIGRCYLPLTLLHQHSLEPKDLLQAENSLKAKPLLNELIRLTLVHFCHATKYLLAIPHHCVRLRLACLWPIVIGLETLLLLVRTHTWLDLAQPCKVKRKAIYRIIASSLPIIASNFLLQRWIKHLIGQIEAELNKSKTLKSFTHQEF